MLTIIATLSGELNNTTLDVQIHCLYLSAELNNTTLDVKFNSLYVDNNPWKGCSIGDVPPTLVTTTEESITSPVYTTVAKTPSAARSTRPATSMAPTDNKSSTVQSQANATTTPTTKTTTKVLSVNVSEGWGNVSFGYGAESTSGSPPEVFTATMPNSATASESSTPKEPLALSVTSPTTLMDYNESTSQFATSTTTGFERPPTRQIPSPTPSYAVETLEPVVSRSSPDIVPSSSNQESSLRETRVTLQLLSSLFSDAAPLEISQPPITVTQYVTLTKHVSISVTSSATLPISTVDVDVVTSSDFQIALTSQNGLQSTTTRETPAVFTSSQPPTGQSTVTFVTTVTPGKNTPTVTPNKNTPTVSPGKNTEEMFTPFPNPLIAYP